MLKYLLILVLVVSLCSVWAYLEYDESRLLDNLNNQMTLMIKNDDERRSLKESLMVLSHRNSENDAFEGKRNGPIHKAVVKTTDGNYYYLVYLEHHSNRHEINKVYIVSDTEILDCNDGHICGSVNVIGRCKDLKELISSIRKSD